MIGRLNDSKNVTVVGAGISGLLVSYYLDRAGYRVRLIEAQERSGGLISTRETSHGLVESAAHSFPATPTLRELCTDLGVELVSLKPDSKARFIYRKGRMRSFPLSVTESIRAFFRAYFVLAPKTDPEAMDLEEWARHFLGEPALKYLLTPFVRGIYGTEPSQINVSAAFPALCVPRGNSLLSYLLARKLRRKPPVAVRRALPEMPRGEIAAPLKGMAVLTQALERRLKERLGERFEKGRKVGSLSELSIGADNLILCVPASEAAHLVREDASELSSLLEKVRYSPLTTATIFLEEKSFKRGEPRGLGVLIPKEEARRCLGVLFNSSAFEGRTATPGIVSLTMMFDCSPGEKLRSVVQDELRALFGVSDPVLEIVEYSWEDAVPKYDEHLLKTWELAEKTWCAHPGRILFGNYTGQVSIRGMGELSAALLNDGERVKGAVRRD